MKKLIMLVVAGLFSVSAAAHACDGLKNAKAQKAGTVAKKDATKKEEKPKS